jgi:membrane glycosyltransferase
VRQTAAVVSILGGRDCGWKPAGGAAKGSDERLWLEPLVSIAILLLAAAGAEKISEWAIALPIALPLWLAPVLSRWFDERPATEKGETLPALQPALAVLRR